MEVKDILKENQEILMTWNSFSRNYYEGKGYKYTKEKDEFYVKVEDLNKHAKKKVIVICDCCGKEYEQCYYQYNDIVKTHGNSLCSKCRRKEISERKINASKSRYFEILNEICKEKGYILLSTEDECINRPKSKIKIYCPIHGEQTASLRNFLRRKRCPKCGLDKRAKDNSLTPDEVEDYINSINGNILLNKEEYVKISVKNLRIKCGLCGEEYVTSLHAYKHGFIKCRKCSQKISNGELKILQYLENNSIEFEHEYSFKDCRNLWPLRFDFYLPQYKCAIEFDGRQHYDKYPFEYYGSPEAEAKLAETKRRDAIKNEYCKTHDIYLIRIPFWNINKIDDILDKKLITYIKDIV